VPKRIRRNINIRILKKMDELEERLIVLWLHFLQIRELGQRYRKPQLGLIGRVIIVPTDISRIQHALPHNINKLAQLQWQ
jgi:hypothetical protein